MPPVRAQNKLAEDLAQPDRALIISAERLLFGAIALNLIIILYLVIIVAAIILGALDYIAITKNTDASSMFILDVIVCCAAYPFLKFCIWGVRGFLEVRVVPIVTFGVFFTGYGVSGIISGRADGYVAIATVMLTIAVIVYSHWRDILQRGFRLQ